MLFSWAPLESASRLFCHSSLLPLPSVSSLLSTANMPALIFPPKKLMFNRQLFPQASSHTPAEIRPHEHLLLQKPADMHEAIRALRAGTQGHRWHRGKGRQKCTSCAESCLLGRKWNARKVVLVPQGPLFFAWPRFSGCETYRRGLEDMMFQSFHDT